MQQLAKAIAITSDAFKGDLDKGGVPYIMHCLHVMNIVGKKTDHVARLDPFSRRLERLDHVLV